MAWSRNSAEADLPAASTCQRRSFVAVTSMSWKVTVVFAPGVSVMHTSFPEPRPGRRCSAEPGLGCTSRVPLRSPVGKGTLVAARHQSAQWDNLRVRFAIQVHYRGAVAIEVSQDADATAKADAFAYPRLALITVLQLLVQRVCLPPHLGRGIRPADPFARLRNRHGDCRDRRRHRRCRASGGGHGYRRG